MKRRTFLRSIFGAIVASKLALELTAKAPVVAGLDVGFKGESTFEYAGFTWVVDPDPQRYIFDGTVWHVLDPVTITGDVNPAYQSADPYA